MDPVRSSLRFVVGTALLTTAGVGAACTEKPMANTVTNDGKAGSDTRPEDQGPVVDVRATPERAEEPPPNVNMVPSPPEPEPPIVNTRPEDEPPQPVSVNTVPSPPEPEPTKRRPIINPVPPKLDPPRVNTLPPREPAPNDKPPVIVNTRPNVETLDE